MCHFDRLNYPIADDFNVSVSGSNPLPPVNPAREPRGDTSRLEQTNKDRKRRQDEDQRNQSGSQRQKGSDSVQLSADATASRSNPARAHTPSNKTNAPKRLDLNA